MLEISLVVLAYLALLAAVLVLLRTAKRADEEIERAHEALMREGGTVPWKRERPGPTGSSAAGAGAGLQR